uniref:G-protein coupled receptors family 1 profile domain-containing protein n=1 Tax=Anopheles farauti TaxID=69004 RepID=A0A182QWR3_9DIPT
MDGKRCRRNCIVAFLTSPLPPPFSIFHVDTHKRQNQQRKVTTEPETVSYSSVFGETERPKSDKMFYLYSRLVGVLVTSVGPGAETGQTGPEKGPIGSGFDDSGSDSVRFDSGVDNVAVVMDLKAGKHLVAPAINNISCSHNRFAGHFLHQIGAFDVIQALFIVLLTFLVISANLMVILVINSRRYAAYIHPQPRYLLTSLALNDLAIGLLIIPFSALPALLHCWPYGEIFCQIQALLRGALSQQSAVILVCMAVDRYLCVLHPRIYHKRSSKKHRNKIVTLTGSTGKRWRARYVILAVSCQDLRQISILPTEPLYPDPPDSQLGLWCMANFTVHYQAPYWRDHGFTGCVFSPTQSLIVHESDRNQLSGTFFLPLRGILDDTERTIVRETILRLLRENFACRTMQKPLECRLDVQPIPFYFDVLPTYRRCLIFASTNASCWYRGFINGSVQGGIRAAILALLEIRPQTITFREVTDMQCIHFKYFRRRSVFERFWCVLNLASVCRFASVVIGTGMVVLAAWGCVAVLSVTWILCLTCFGMLVLPKGYYFNKTGLLACEPFYSKSSYRILSSCALYFPTTMVLMYCYGSSFHANRYRLATPSGTASLSLAASNSCGNGNGSSNGPHPGGESGTGGGAGRRDGDHIETLVGPTLTANGSGLEHHHSCDGTTLTGITAITPMSVSFSEKSQFAADDDRRIHGSTSRTMAAISLGFIVIITPWTILEIVATCTGSKIPPSIDFFVTWIALSSSFWNPFLYWLLNARFRKICKELLTSKCTGSRSSLEEKCSISLEYDHHLTTLPLPPGPPPATICRSANHTPRPDVECSEKYWGDILERTYSSGSINTLHRLGTSSLGTFVNRTPTSYRCEAHQTQLMRNASSTSIAKDRHYDRDGAHKDQTDFSALYPPGSDPQVCDHELHDINCAKNKAFFRGFNLHQGLPDI